MVPNINSFDPSEKRINLVYNNDISGFQALDFSKLDEIETAVKNSFPVYDSVELFYDGSNNTGVFYKKNGVTTRIIEMRYAGSVLTGVIKTDL